MASNFDVVIMSFINNLHFNNSIYSRKCFDKFSISVLLDEWLRNMLIRFSKQVANTFSKITNGCKGEFKTLSNI